MQILHAVQAVEAKADYPLLCIVSYMVLMYAQAFTSYTLYQLWKHGKNAAGGARLTKYVRQDGIASAVRVCYAGA